MAAVACSLCSFLFNHCHPVTGKRPSPASRGPPAWGLLHRGLADFEKKKKKTKWLGFQFLQRVFTLYPEISSSPNMQGCQEEVNREASWWVLFLDAGVESVQPAFMLVPSRHFLPPSHRPNEQQTHQERFHNSSSAWHILKQWLQFPIPPRD